MSRKSSGSNGRVERIVRVVTALSMGGFGAVRGCGVGTIGCECPTDGSDAAYVEVERSVCSSQREDSGCRNRFYGAGPLAPPEQTTHAEPPMTDPQRTKVRSANRQRFERVITRRDSALDEPPRRASWLWNGPRDHLVPLPCDRRRRDDRRRTAVASLHAPRAGRRVHDGLRGRDDRAPAARARALIANHQTSTHNQMTPSKPALRRARYLDRALRFVTALSLGGAGVVRGCGGGAVYCECTPNGGSPRDAAVFAACSAREQDAGCVTIYEGSGPLPPPELVA